jgi:hypothetical protein
VLQNEITCEVNDLKTIRSLQRPGEDSSLQGFFQFEGAWGAQFQGFRAENGNAKFANTVDSDCMPCSHVFVL